MFSSGDIVRIWIDDIGASVVAQLDFSWEYEANWEEGVRWDFEVLDPYIYEWLMDNDTSFSVSVKNILRCATLEEIDEVAQKQARYVEAALYGVTLPQAFEKIREYVDRREKEVADDHTS